MTVNTPDVETLFSELEELVQKIEVCCKVIAKELANAPPVNAARVNDEMFKITHLRNQSFTFFQHLNQVQRAISEQQRLADGGRGVLPVEWLRLGTRAGHIRVWLNQWTDVQSLLREILAQRRIKLFRKPEKLGTTAQAQIESTDQLFSRLGRILNPSHQSDEARDLGCYEDIAYPMTAFVQHMQAARRVLLAMGRTRGASFLDIGCGGGIKVLAAQDFFDRSSGLEFDRNYVRRARKLLRESGRGNGRIISADGIKYRKYNEYDVVFMFRPMSDGDQRIRLEEQVINNVHPRTVIVAPYKSFAARAAERGCPHIAGGLFLANSPRSEATGLRRRAEFMGNSLGLHSARFPGLFDSILAAASEKGFRIEERNPLLDV